MKARYPLVARAHYPGRLEAVTVYRFRTTGRKEAAGGNVTD
jgi:hypothetical protein